MKPTLFIGSSSEQSDIALAIQSNLDAVASVTVWSQGAFGLSKSWLDSLLEAFDKSDFGVLVLSPDDALKLRDHAYQVPRDNLVFELGLGIGRIGRERTYFVVPSGVEDLHLPSDLAGIKGATYDPERSDLEAALGPACFKIRQLVKSLGVRPARLPQSSVETVPNAAFLCASTPQFERLGFEGDVSVLTAAFPERVEVERGLTAQRLEKLLTSQRFAVAHLLCYVHPRTGEVVFSEVTEDGTPVGPKMTMPAEGFVKLVEFSRVRLVVLASCDSLILAAKLARVTNAIAATDWIESDPVVRWESSFYDCLTNGQPLSTADELATSINDLPMLLLLKKDFALER
jgi:hypothetical protein